MLKVYSLTQKLRFIESVFGSGRLATNGKNFDVRCPICAPSDNSKRKLAIRVTDDVNHCWTCGWKSHTLAPLIRRFGTTSQLSKYREEFMPQGTRDENLESIEEKKSLHLPQDFCLLTNASQSDPDAKAAWAYLKSRGITRKDAWYYKLGISNEYRWRRRIIIPSFDSEGNLNFFVARNIDSGDKRARYDGPDEDKLPIIFNEINIDWKRKLVICEGAFDVMKCGENSVPLLGSDLNEQSRLFNQILLHNTSIALALDGDMWYTKTPRIVKKMQEYDVNVSIVDVRQWDDPGKMTKQQFKIALEDAITPTWEDNFYNKLQRASELKMRM